MVGAAVDVSRPAVPEYRKLFAVKPDRVRLVVVTEAGSDRVTEPVDADAVIWFAEPVMLVTPLLVIVTAPVAPETPIPVPATAEVTPALVMVSVPAPIDTVIPVPCATVLYSNAVAPALTPITWFAVPRDDRPVPPFAAVTGVVRENCVPDIVRPVPAVYVPAPENGTNVIAVVFSVPP